MGSQGSEDLFNVAKNSRLVKGKKRFRRPEKSMAAMISRGIVDTVHRYTGVQPDTGAQSTAALPLTAFKARAQDCTLPVQHLASTKQATTWYTTTPEDTGRVYADLQLYKDMAISKMYHKAGQAWLSQLCHFSHNFAMRLKVAPDAWFLPLRNWGDSAVLVWPVLRRPFPGQNEFFWFEPVMDLVEPRLVSLLDLQEWSAVTFAWRSPLWQKINVQVAFDKVPCAIRRVTSESPRGLLEVAAQQGFWRLDLGFLSKLAKHLALDMSPASSLMQVLLRLVCSIKRCEHEDALVYLQKRLAENINSNRHAEDLLEVEELDSVLEPGDVKVMNQTKETAKRDVLEAKDSF
jgi:hypothetical protein